MERLIAALFALTLLAACKGERAILGEQCPRPGSPGSTVAKGSGPSQVYGTSCAPCEGDEVKYDDMGCPTYVTWASCNGDICIGGELIPRPRPDAGSRDGGGDEDAGSDEDAGRSSGDGS